LITEYQPCTNFDLLARQSDFSFSDYKRTGFQVFAHGKKICFRLFNYRTFSETGPEKCSGLQIKRYSEENLTSELRNGFDKIRCIGEDHITPFGTMQNFLFVVSSDA